MTDGSIILHAALIPGIGDVTIGRLVAALGTGGLADLYGFGLSDLAERVGMPLAQARLLIEGLRDRGRLEREQALLQQHGIYWSTFIDDDYPVQLRNIYAPPAVLFWRGVSPSSFSQVIACIGSRAANRYARSVINHLVPDLVAAGCCIASGGALGADTMAHEAALAAAGHSVAIIGAGLLRPYPTTNKKLFDRIVDAGGTVMSPFPLEMQAVPGNFPARNRIIAGLSRAVVVVQAAEKSGARITALQALEQGREVCIVPGDIFDPLSAGCHRLLAEGATPVTSAADVLVACGWSSGAERVTQAISESPGPGVISDPLLEFCREARTFDELLVLLGCEFSELQERLFALQIEGIVAQDFLGRWSVA
ncbi:MAG: DNA-processing protein DprA [Candidatus Dependentiae bacterium]|nr:DNA-processing protein DprA [Candidatus Dependentiae bacterium]